MSKAAAKKGSKESLWAPFLKGTDYGIRRTAKGEWYVRKMTKRGTEWIRADKTEVKHYLEAEYCLCGSSDDEAMSDADRAMNDALATCVEFAGAYAGYREPGEIAVGDDTVLITRGIRLTAPEAGDCSFVRDVIRAFFPTSHTETITIDAQGNIVRDTDGNVVPFKDCLTTPEIAAGGKMIEPDDRINLRDKTVTVTQYDAVFGWCKGALTTLREAKPGKWRHGQALIMIGLHGAGKTAFQRIITALFTGRATDPELYFKDKTSFNEQMGENEHWLMSDPKTTNPAAQKKFLGDIKHYVANVWMPIHPKGGKLVSLATFRRMTVAVNTDNEALAILRNMAASDFDKVIILDFKNARELAPDGLAYGGLSWEEWEETMTSQLPAFIHWLLNEYEIPEHMKHKRYGVVYHNPEMEPELAAASSGDVEDEVLEIIGHGVFTNIKAVWKADGENGEPPVLKETGPLTVGEIVDRVTHPRSPVIARVKQHPDYFASKNHTRLGTLLSKKSGAPDKPRLHERSPFTIARHPIPGNKSKYSFRGGA